MKVVIVGAGIECWPYVRHRAPARYAGPGVVLIGDAVHAMLPSLAQGVSQTLEDAWVLARELERRPDPADALLAYQRGRRLNVIAVSRQRPFRSRNGPKAGCSGTRPCPRPC
jgi:2-polyprenyl-6-methoxyphenol hydroxylase-like FAD-dependent oxidoreductase